MSLNRNLMLATVVEGSVIAAWLAWGYCATGANWDFEALNTLFSGLAFGGLVLTLWIQHGEIQSQEKATRETLNAFNRISEILALGTMRANAGSRIEHLKGLQKRGEESTEGMTPTQVTEEIGELKKRIPKIEAKIVELTAHLFPS